MCIRDSTNTPLRVAELALKRPSNDCERAEAGSPARKSVCFASAVPVHVSNILHAEIDLTQTAPKRVSVVNSAQSATWSRPAQNFAAQERSATLQRTVSSAAYVARNPFAKPATKPARLPDGLPKESFASKEGRTARPDVATETSSPTRAAHSNRSSLAATAAAAQGASGPGHVDLQENGESAATDSVIGKFGGGDAAADDDDDDFEAPTQRAKQRRGGEAPLRGLGHNTVNSFLGASAHAERHGSTRPDELREPVQEEARAETQQATRGGANAGAAVAAAEAVSSRKQPCTPSFGASAATPSTSKLATKRGGLGSSSRPLKKTKKVGEAACKSTPKITAFLAL
eukprot:5359768-Pleurochrysis_carterae.AAC.4